MDKRTNIFYHATKELTTDAFLVWLIYYLDSDQKYSEQKQFFFDTLILKKEDVGKRVDCIKLDRQEEDADVTLRFKLEDSNDEQVVVFEDKIGTTFHGNQPQKHKRNFPNCYRYIYYKLAYINSQEKKKVESEGFDIIDASMMSKTIEEFKGIHILVRMYYDYITNEFVNKINSYRDDIFNKKNYDVLRNEGAQKYLCEIIVESMRNQDVPYIRIDNGSSFGLPWTEIVIAETEKGYGERLFWRVHIRSGKFYIRLNQYSKPKNEDEIIIKGRRLNDLREEANRYIESNYTNLKLGEVVNLGIKKQNEVIIFFLKDNDLEPLIESLPMISKHMKEFFDGLSM